MSFAKSAAAAPRLQGESDLHETLAIALDLENGQLLHFAAADGSEHRPGGPVEYFGSALRNELVEVQLTVSKARSFVPSTAILRRHWQRKSSLEEVMLELYYGNLSVAKADEIARLLWGAGAGSALISEQAPRITLRIQAWLERRISEPYIYVFLHSLKVKQKLGGENRIVGLFVAIGIRGEGNREVLGVMSTVGAGSDGWTPLISSLKQRGLAGTALFIGENDPAAPAVVRAHFPLARYQGSLTCLERDVLARVRPAMMHSVLTAFEVVRASVGPGAAAAELAALAARLAREGAPEAATLLNSAADFQFTYYGFPRRHWPRLHDNKPAGRLLGAFREWIRLIGPVSEDHALTLMVAARLRSTARRSWGRRRYFAK